MTDLITSAIAYSRESCPCNSSLQSTCGPYQSSTGAASAVSSADGHCQQQPEVVERLQSFFGLFDGAEHDSKCTFQAYQSVFHPDLVSIIFPVAGTNIGDILDPAKRVELEFHETFEHIFRTHKKLRTEFDQLSLQSVGDLIFFSVEYELMGHLLATTFRAEVRNDLVIFLEQEDTTFKVLESIKKMTRCFDCEKYDVAGLFDAFEEMFDKDATGLTSRIGGSSMTNITNPEKREVLGYDEMYQDMRRAIFLVRCPLLVTNIKPYPDGRIDYVIKGSYLGHNASFQCSAMTRKGKVLHLDREAARVEVIENLKAFLNLFQGTLQKVSHETLFAAFERVFDKSSHALVYEFGAPVQDMTQPEKRSTLDFHQLFYDHFKPYALLGHSIQLVSIKPRFNGGIEYTVRVAGYAGHDLSWRFIGATRDGKIFHLKHEETVVVTKLEREDVDSCQGEPQETERTHESNDDDEDDDDGEEDKSVRPTRKQQRRPTPVPSYFRASPATKDSGEQTAKEQQSGGRRFAFLRLLSNKKRQQPTTTAMAA